MPLPHSPEFALSVRCAICGKQLLTASAIIHGTDGEPFCSASCASAYEAELNSYLEEAAQETADAFSRSAPYKNSVWLRGTCTRLRSTRGQASATAATSGMECNPHGI